jgi:DNA-binding LacI/PurR family transcriptional regulator/anti-anti-sigma regulatory factor/putative methionine-R-sulfoxide reductase with GAF domain
MNKQGNNQEGATRSAGSRPTVGLLGEVGRSPYHRALWEGVFTGALELDVNLLWYLGTPLSASGQAVHHTIDRQLLNAERVDGLLISGTLGNNVSVTEFRSFTDTYRPMPMVGITLVPGLPSVVVDNEVGMRAVVTHLIEVHGYRRIAFICGPENNEEAALRYRAYADVLIEHDIPLDPALVAPGMFLYESGGEAIHLLLDERGVAFEAVVAANDWMALGALAALEDRGIRVPDDVAVTGFDDTKEATASLPPLTTVRQPIRQIGYTSIQVMLKLLAGERIPEHTVLPSELVVRQSCGCADLMIERAGARALVEGTEARGSIDVRREEIISEMVQMMGPTATSFPEWAGRLLDAFLEEMASGSKDESEGGSASSEDFLSVLGDALRQVDVVNGQFNRWQDVLSVMRRHTLPYISDALAPRVEDRFNQGRAMIGKTIQRHWMFQEEEVARHNSVVSNLRDELTTLVEIGRLFSALDRRLPQMDFSTFYLSLYEGQVHATRWSRLMLAYEAGERIEVGASGRRFLTHRLVPDELLPSGRRYSWLVAPLDFGENRFGHMIFEMQLREAEIYRALTRLVSSSMQELALVRQLDIRRAQMLAAAEISRVVTSMLDLQALIQNVVELVQERFDLYHVGLFLVEGDWAVLRAATGEAGPRMLEQKHGLQMDGDSMIGRCITEQRACIALDVGQDAVQFDNPLLPATRSELALPLLGREDVIGALSIQSVREEAFGEEDVAVFQTIVDQLTNAIENARLYAKIQDAYAEVEQQVAERTAELKREQEESARLQQEVIEAQQRAIQELSTPIIPVLEGVIVMPLIGSIDTTRARDVTRNLLAGIREHHAKVVILDITGVPIVDSGVAAYLNRTVQAARLKGARTIVTGISEAVAETIVDLGIDWSGIETLRDLRTGLQLVLAGIGVRGR